MSRIDKAFERFDRREFLQGAVRSLAGQDLPLPIGYGQTNSQPTTVRLMLEWLDAQPGNKILDIGSGSGWTTALLSYISGPKGKVYALELVPQLVEFGRQNCDKYRLNNVEFYQASSHFGLRKFAPYDRILVSAAAKQLPDELIGQLANKGKMVMPVGNDVLEIFKNNNGTIEIETHPGFAFVPLL